MSFATKELKSLSILLQVRGTAAMALAAVALSWPRQALGTATLVAGAVLVGCGGYEMGMALLLGSRIRRLWILFLHGFACLAFGVLTLISPVIPFYGVLILSAVWLALYAAFCTLTAATLRHQVLARWSLLVWALANLWFATRVVLLIPTTAASLLYLGSCYAVLFGLAQIASGMWIGANLQSLAGEVGVAEPDTVRDLLTKNQGHADVRATASLPS